MWHTMLVSAYAISVILWGTVTGHNYSLSYNVAVWINVFPDFWQNYCRKTIEATTVKKIPNERKLIYAIYNFIVASWCLLFSYCCTTTNLNGIFGDVNFSVNGNREILKCMFTLNGTYLRTKITIHFNILLYIAILYLTSIPLNLF